MNRSCAKTLEDVTISRVFELLPTHVQCIAHTWVCVCVCVCVFVCVYVAYQDEQVSCISLVYSFVRVKSFLYVSFYVSFKGLFIRRTCVACLFYRSEGRLLGVEDLSFQIFRRKVVFEILGLPRQLKKNTPRSKVIVLFIGLYYRSHFSHDFRQLRSLWNPQPSRYRDKTRLFCKS